MSLLILACAGFLLFTVGLLIGGMLREESPQWTQSQRDDLEEWAKR